MSFDRRRVLLSSTLGLSLSALPRSVLAQASPIRVGLMLPSTGTFAPLGDAIYRGLTLALTQSKGMWGGRPVEIIRADDESNPAKAAELASRLISRDRADLLIGSVHSGVALGMAKVAADQNRMLIIPNAGANRLTGAGCSEQIIRTSFSNWQTIAPLGKIMADRGIKTAVFLTWKYTAGDEFASAFTEGFEAHGGKVLGSLSLPFPQAEFGPLLTRIAALKPDAVSCFFSGTAAAKFLADYDRSGLRRTIPLYVTGHVTEGILHTLKNEADGVVSVLHYADGLPYAADKRFRAAHQQQFGAAPDVFAVQGFDTGLVLERALAGTRGDLSPTAIRSVLRDLTIDSPRGAWRFSAAQNPIQDIYLREVRKGQNQYLSVAAKALADPASGCRLG
ncbi:MAG: ABC transporter permease [Betaproteobacteria bacterium]|nr:ABC transporter permease [Betaproteobacteria bacterium]